MKTYISDNRPPGIGIAGAQVKETAVLKPIPGELADLGRSLNQLHAEIEQLEGALQSVSQPCPANAETKDGAPLPSGLLGEIYGLHRGVRAAIDRLHSVRESLTV